MLIMLLIIERLMVFSMVYDLLKSNNDLKSLIGARAMRSIKLITIKMIKIT